MITFLSENEYFKYPKEIDYYTGLTRSDEDFFQTILDRFNAKFKPTDALYDSMDFDKYFTDQIKLGNKEHEYVAKNVDEKKIKDNRPDEKAMETFYNERLSQIPDTSVIYKNEEGATHEMLLIIMANVLRNSEGVENKALKAKAYAALVKYSLVWTILYHAAVIRYVVEYKKLPPSLPNNIDFKTFITYFPVSVQSGMNNHVGSSKLSQIVLEKFKSDLTSSSISDLETFFSALLYADIQGNDFPKYLKQFVKSLKKNVVRDYTFYKLIDYYYRRTRPNSPNEQIYLDLLTDLRIRTQKLPQRLKMSVMRELKKSKESFQFTQS